MGASHSNQNNNDNAQQNGEPVIPPPPLRRQIGVAHYARLFQSDPNAALAAYNAATNQALTANEFKAIIGATQTPNSGPF